MGIKISGFHHHFSSVSKREIQSKILLEILVVLSFAIASASATGAFNLVRRGIVHSQSQNCDCHFQLYRGTTAALQSFRSRSKKESATEAEGHLARRHSTTRRNVNFHWMIQKIMKVVKGEISRARISSKKSSNRKFLNLRGSI